MAPKSCRHNVITNEAARLLYSKIEASNIPIAVFAHNGSWNSTRVTSANFSRQIQAAPDKFVGIYDINSRFEWIADDLESVGIR